MRKVDWSGLLAGHDGYFEHVNARSTRRAVAALVDPDIWRDAVDTYVLGRPGHGAARGVIRFVHPSFAFERCMAIYRDTGNDTAQRRMAVDLAACAADADDLVHLAAFLDDPDEQIQALGAKMLDELYMTRAADEDQLLPHVRQCLDHSNPQVRAVGILVLSMICDDGTDIDDEDQAAFVAAWTDQDAAVREQALEVSPAHVVIRHVSALAELLHDENANVRRSAAQALTADPSRARILLEPLRSDPDARVREFAETWLGGGGHA